MAVRDHLVRHRDMAAATRTTHITIVESPWTIGVTGISWPFSSLAFVTLKAESTEAVTMNRVVSTK